MTLNAIKNRLYIRAAEVNLIRRFLPIQCKILEIGGGNGWQAKIIASWGFEISSIDVELLPDLLHTVELYDGVKIPFPTENFNIIFSSNVLEHVEMRALLFADMRRVLKSGGYMIHIVPSASWRLWTAIAHYPFLVKRIVQTVFRIRSVNIKADDIYHESQNIPQTGGVIFDKLKNSLWPVPHGIDRSVFRELSTFSRWGWRACFRDADLSLVYELRNGIFYTGYRLLPWMGLRPRRFLANLLGSSCHIFILRNPASSRP